MENPIKSLIPKPEPGPGIAKEIGETARQATNENNMALHPPEAAPVKAAPIGAPAPMKRVQSPYGTGEGAKRGEKRIDVSDMVKPLGTMHSGGTVPKTGPYVLKAGEKVLTGDQHDKLHKAMGLAASALSHGQDTEPEPPKVLRSMNIKELHTGGFHIQKHDGMGGMTEHGAPHNDAVVGHFMDHMAHPDEDEEAAEAGDHDMHAADAEHEAIGG